MKDVISSSRTLVHLHRKTLSKITDADIDNQSKNRRIAELHVIINNINKSCAIKFLCHNFQKIIEEFKSKLNKNVYKGTTLENKLVTLQNEKADFIKREAQFKEEMDKIKRYHTSKQNEMVHQYKKLARDYQNLKKIYEKGRYLLF